MGCQGRSIFDNSSATSLRNQFSISNIPLLAKRFQHEGATIVNDPSNVFASRAPSDKGFAMRSFKISQISTPCSRRLEHSFAHTFFFAFLRHLDDILLTRRHAQTSLQPGRQHNCTAEEGDEAQIGTLSLQPNIATSTITWLRHDTSLVANNTTSRILFR